MCNCRTKDADNKTNNLEHKKTAKKLIIIRKKLDQKIIHVNSCLNGYCMNIKYNQMTKFNISIWIFNVQI